MRTKKRSDAVQCKKPKMAEKRLRFDKAIYDKAALLRAAYWFTADCYAKLSQEDPNWIVSLQPKAKNADMRRLAAEFINRALDETLRRRVESETRNVRNLIMAHALSKATFINKDLENVAVGQDPLNVLSAIRTSSDVNPS